MSSTVQPRYISRAHNLNFTAMRKSTGKCKFLMLHILGKCCIKWEHLPWTIITMCTSNDSCVFFFCNFLNHVYLKDCFSSCLLAVHKGTTKPHPLSYLHLVRSGFQNDSTPCPKENLYDTDAVVFICLHRAILIRN